MKEKSFKFRESFGTAVKAMDDKTAGKFIKGLCAYCFDDKHFCTNDHTLQSCYSLVKSMLESDRFSRESGIKGGRISAEIRKHKIDNIIVVKTSVSANKNSDEKRGENCCKN